MSGSVGGPSPEVGTGSGPPSESTQVSFEPPPRDELTIIWPSSSATRVRPPGMIRSSEP